MTADTILASLQLSIPEIILAVGALALLMVGVFSGERSGTTVTGLAVALGLKLSGREIGMTSRLPLGTLLAIAAFPAWLYSVGV